ncbi:hypothetical protein KQX54_013802 [Cotesia glomerata]|uniref:Uncharacterized protein n=1 Tax=Cotesia glomerata TaxID=32391 RepID=A0AAV7IVB1_COTGL|nr:hypothetical protein KQX54_013802 [Cotesia glomerata]
MVVFGKIEVVSWYKKAYQDVSLYNRTACSFESSLNNETMEFKITSRKIPKGNMMMTWSSLELKAASGLFRDSRLGLRCFANIDGIYTATAEYEITEDAPLLAPITGDASPHRGNSVFEDLWEEYSFNGLFIPFD